MKIHHIRNATLVIETANRVILVDPMLGEKGESAPSFVFFRSKARRNPIVDLPEGAMGIIQKTTHCLLTHLHPDHLDGAAIKFLRDRKIQTICSAKDENVLRKKGLNIIQTVEYWKESAFLGGKIQGIPAVHGYGYVSKLMGNVMGFYIELPNEKTIYLSADTIYTKDVHHVLADLKPDIAVVAGGAAQFDIFKPVLMRMDEIERFVQNAPDEVIINHLEAINHCPMSREQLRKGFSTTALSQKVHIPDDGEVLNYKSVTP